MKDAHGNELQPGDAVTVTRPVGPLRFVGQMGRVVKLGKTKVHIIVSNPFFPESLDVPKTRAFDPKDLWLGEHKLHTPLQDKLEENFEVLFTDTLRGTLSKAVRGNIISKEVRIAILKIYDEQEW